MEPRKKIEPRRFERIERDENIEIHEDENSHLWAVSYSDFLMVLLSFFILFYSVDEDKQDQLIFQIAKNFAGNSNAQGIGANKNHEPVKSAIERIPTSLFDHIKSLQVNLSENKKHLTINFPDDLFAIGSHELNQENEKVIIETLNILKPHSQNLYLYFEGHTDDRPLHTKVRNINLDNYVLSSLRASSALLKAQQLGFPEEQMFIQAASSHIRNSRSLSLRVSQKGAEL